MFRVSWRMGAALGLLAFLIAGGTAGAGLLGPRSSLHTGVLAGARYRIEMPGTWNRVLLLYSHGYVPQGRPDPALDAPDPITGGWLLGQGFALAGSAYTENGWAVAQAMPQQLALLRYFEATYGRPSQVIAWGESMGGLITAALVLKDPSLFKGALPLCGALSGSNGFWDRELDAEYAFKTLVAPASGIQLVHISHPTANYRQASDSIAAAQESAAGRARLALVAAIAGIPGWFAPSSPKPPQSDAAAMEEGQFQWEQHPDLYFGLALRAEMEKRAGGNPSSNVGVDYRRIFEQSPARAEVQTLYRAAGLRLGADLDALNAGSRVAADARARAYASRFATLSGPLEVPVLTIHDTGDGLVRAGAEARFASSAGAGPTMLRQAFVARAGHCQFTPAEMAAGIDVLMVRVETGHWPQLAPGALDVRARSLGTFLSRLWWPDVPANPAFTAYSPSPARA